MIIDVHTHVWSNLDQLGAEVASRLRSTQAERWGHLDASVAALEQATAPIDGAIVIGLRADRVGASIPHEYVAQAVATVQGRVFGIGGVDPMCDDALDQVEAAVHLGLAGISVAPVLQGFHPAHSAAMRIYERCVEAAMPVFVLMPHPLTQSAELQFGRPVYWDEVARSFPELRLVIGQLGYPWIDETLAVIGKHPNVYSDISLVASRPWQLYNTLLTAQSFGVMDKLLFGSGFPYETPAKTIESLYSVNAISQGSQLPSISRSAMRAIVERNSLACLGLEVVAATGRGPAEIEVEIPRETRAAAEDRV